MTTEATTLFDLVPGKRVLDRYRVVAPSRQGGLSTAFEVEDEIDGAHFELQLFPSGLFANEEQTRDFAAAWSPWKRVQSSAVQALRDILFLGPTSLALLTDMPRGETLRQRMKSGDRFELPAVLQIGRQLLSGLVDIHAHGLVHGDLKPSTIHIDGSVEEPSASMVDGGVTPGLWTAKHLGDQTALIGTPYYAPVEQFGGDSPDVQSDVYNLATVLFELVTGVLPWRGTTFLDVFQAKLDRSAPSMRDRAPDVEVDPEVEAAIVRGLLADRSQRYSTATQFLEAIDGL